MHTNTPPASNQCSFLNCIGQCHNTTGQQKAGEQERRGQERRGEDKGQEGGESRGEDRRGIRVGMGTDKGRIVIG